MSEHKSTGTKRPERILLIRLSSLGDIVLTTPLVRALRRAYPACRIDFLVKAKFTGLLEAHPDIAEVIPFPDRGSSADLIAWRRKLRERRYDLILDLHKSIRSLMLTGLQRRTRVRRVKKYGFRRLALVKLGIDLYREITPVYARYLAVAEPLGIRDDCRGTRIYYPPEAAQAAAEIFNAAFAGRPAGVVGIAPGAGFATKRWPVANFARLAQWLVERGKKCCLLGSESEQHLAAEICAACPGGVADFTGRLSLVACAAVLAKCESLVANDSGLMHLAEAVGTPVVAIFGATVRQLGFFPLDNRSRVVENPDVRCRPCSHIGRNTCPKRHFDCMKTLTPERVLQALEETAGAGGLRVVSQKIA